MCAHSVVQSCPTLCNPMDCSPPGSLSMGFSKQEYWNGLSFPSPRDLFNPGIKHVSYIPCIGRWILSHSFLPTPFFLPYMYKNMGLFLIFFFDYHYGLSDFSPIKCLRISMIIITLFVTKFVWNLTLGIHLWLVLMSFKHDPIKPLISSLLSSLWYSRSTLYFRCSRNSISWSQLNRLNLPAHQEEFWLSHPWFALELLMRPGIGVGEAQNFSGVRVMGVSIQV